MLDKITLHKKLSKKVYKDQFNKLRKRLFLLQRAYWECELASLVVVEGWDGSGKGEIVSKLTERLEPRAFKLHFVRPPRTHEVSLPAMWRFWMQVPSYREMGIFVPSWYAGFIEARLDPGIDESEWFRTWRRVSDFERALADDRYVVVKLFLHLDKKTRRRRLEQLTEDPATRWKVDQGVLDAHERYDEYLTVIEDVLARTESEWGPWTIIEASDPRGARVRAAEALVARLEAGLERHGHGQVLDGLLGSDDEDSELSEEDV